jgi:Uma2 family endonuclease
MPVEAIAESEIFAPPGYPNRKRWTRAECEALESTGLWDTGKLELIEGDLIDRMGKKRPHVTTMILVMEWLAAVFGQRHVTPEAPIDVAPEDNPTSEPQPDLAVLAKPCSEYKTSNPEPAGIRLVVEISDTTLNFDKGVKARLYARAGIVEYWVVDIAGRRILVHRDPQGNAYADIKAYGVSESIELLSAPGRPFPVSEAFPDQD